MNQVLDAIKNRHSCKKYLDKKVDMDLLLQVAEAGKYAPSALNLQSPVFLVVNDKETRDKLSKLNAEVMGGGSDPFYNAPAVIVILADKNNKNHVYDGSLAAENMLLAASSLGLGSCWIHRAKEVFDTAEGKQILKDAGIEGEYEGICNIIVGYPDGELVNKPRKENYIYKIGE